MKVFIAGIEGHSEIINRQKPPYVLFSFANCRGKMPEYCLSTYCKSYLLDSGAFTFMKSSKKVDFDSYVDRYIDFINEYNVPRFFEMDIDSVVGIKKVEEYRRRIESRTNKQCIPVFHRARGKAYFMEMIANYKYIALGGIAVNEIKKSDRKYMKWLIDKSHEHGCKIHGLGYTDFENISNYQFDTIDSTSWLAGARFGNMYSIRNGYPMQKKLKKAGHKTDHKKLNEHNLKVFLKYAKTLEGVYV